jgi:hypothetical protein
MQSCAKGDTTPLIKVATEILSQQQSLEEGDKVSNTLSYPKLFYTI